MKKADLYRIKNLYETGSNKIKNLTSFHLELFEDKMTPKFLLITFSFIWKNKS